MYVGSDYKKKEKETAEIIDAMDKFAQDQNEQLKIEDKTKETPIVTTPVEEKKEEPVYENTGIPNDREFELFCRKPQGKLKALLVNKLKDLGYDPIAKDGFIYAKGDVPVLLTAHMDTVHEKDPYTILTGVCGDVGEYNHKREDIITLSPEGIGGDDRCGIYMIMQIIKTQKCSVVFCEDEEIGCIGSKKFIKDKECMDDINVKFIIEFDRKGEKDAVYYDCDNKDFEKFVSDNTFFKTAYGSCSDISFLAPALKVAAVNLSCGYYNPHTVNEYIILSEVYRNIEEAQKMITKAEEIETSFEYIEKKYAGYYSGYGKYSSGYKGYYDYYDYDRYDIYDDCYDKNGVFDSEKYRQKIAARNEATAKPSTISETEKLSTKHPDYIDDLGDVILEVSFTDYSETDPTTGDPGEGEYTATGKSKAECWGDFFMNNPCTCFNDVTDYYFS